MEHLKKVIISKRAELAAKGGHPWIYGTEIEHADEGIEAGDIVRVESKKGKFVGSGFYNPHSKITVRIFSTNANDTFNAAFWKRRAAYAVLPTGFRGSGPAAGTYGGSLRRCAFRAGALTGDGAA